MKWIFEVDTGKLVNTEGFACPAYAGAPGYRNDPSAQNLANLGPIPRGRYFMTIVDDTHGPRTIYLLPHPANDMFGRSGFLVHGDEIEHPGCGSHGCLCAPRNARDEMVLGILVGDVVLDVMLHGER